MPTFAFAARLSLLAVLSACAAPPPLIARGTAGPTVLFEAGMGNGAEIWDQVTLPPPRLTRFAWTRAGYGPAANLLAGKSWPTDRDGRRTGIEVAAQLDKALQEAGMHGPYILVAHSIGALYSLQFAKTHPDQIAGILLVDPRLPGFTARCKAEDLQGCELPRMLLALLTRTSGLNGPA